ncbi:hypothetical protein WJX84_009134 [Apatococcus fuscideae]|uniref:Uncharacterized protein n=1 Tax=Apatococcus fuscideae TaxID=2026836 RepID=A0AAW1SQV2_9CHLO
MQRTNFCIGSSRVRGGLPSVGTLGQRLLTRRRCCPATERDISSDAQRVAMAGSFPNLAWNGIGMEELRDSPVFGALPPVWDIPLVSSKAYRYVRQDSDLWDALHQGILTTGRLNNALGFYEPMAGKMLGVPRTRISHQALLSIYYHLQDTPFVPPRRWGHPPVAAPAPATATAPATASASQKDPAANGHSSAATTPGPPQNGSERSGLVPEGLKAQPPAGVAGGLRKKARRRPRGKHAGSKAAAGDVQAKLAARMQWREGMERKSRAVASGGAGRVRMAWGTAQEPASLYSLLTAFPDSQLGETGSQPASTQKPRVTNPRRAGRPQVAVLSGSAANVASATQGEAGRNVAAALGPNGMPSDPSQQATQSPLRQPRPIERWVPEGGDDVVLEVVELKNTCPFQEAGTLSHNRKGQLRRQFRISDPGPREQVPTYWVPQLQLEMLTSGAQYALLVSRSATQGIRMFRMERCDQFLRLMLQHVSLLYTHHVIPRRAPPADLHWRSPDYQQLLHLTKQISAECKELGYLPNPAASPTCDRRAFL